MDRAVEFFALVSLLILMVGCVIDPSSSMFWLAGSSIGYTVGRGILIIILATLLLIEPLLGGWIRGVLGMVAIGLTVWTLGSTYQNNMQFLDTLAFASTAIALGIVALEEGYGSTIESAQIEWPVFRRLQKEVGQATAVYALMVFSLIQLLITNHPVARRHPLLYLAVPRHHVIQQAAIAGKT